MRKEDFAERINQLCKLVRTEYGLTQDKMALVLGISKKTLVESEKGRRSLGWTEAALLATVFSESTILQNEFGGDIPDMIQALAFEDVQVQYPQTMGGKVWWKNVKTKGHYRIQQNLISRHYRLLDEHDRRIMSSFSLADVKEYLKLM